MVAPCSSGVSAFVGTPSVVRAGFGRLVRARLVFVEAAVESDLRRPDSCADGMLLSWLVDATAVRGVVVWVASVGAEEGAEGMVVWPAPRAGGVVGLRGLPLPLRAKAAPGKGSGVCRTCTGAALSVPAVMVVAATAVEGVAPCTACSLPRGASCPLDAAQALRP
eukprot:1139626-Pelagomonas_calceolata.AAC.4